MFTDTALADAMSRSRFGNRIDTAGGERMASKQPAEAQPAASPQPVRAQGLDGIFAARGVELAGPDQQRAQGHAVGLDQQNEGTHHHSPSGHSVPNCPYTAVAERSFFHRKNLREASRQRDGRLSVMHGIEMMLGDDQIMQVEMVTVRMQMQMHTAVPVKVN